MEFEVFSKSLIPLKREPTVTIQKSGVISMNKAALTALGSPPAVQLLFDNRSHTIGLRATHSTDDDDAYPIRSTNGPNNGPFVISAMAFLRFYGVCQDLSRRWTAYLDGDILCVDLDDAATVVTSNRARNARAGGG